MPTVKLQRHTSWPGVLCVVRLGCSIMVAPYTLIIAYMVTENKTFCKCLNLHSISGVEAQIN